MRITKVFSTRTHIIIACRDRFVIKRDRDRHVKLSPLRSMFSRFFVVRILSRRGIASFLDFRHAPEDETRRQLRFSITWRILLVLCHDVFRLRYRLMYGISFRVRRIRIITSAPLWSARVFRSLPLSEIVFILYFSDEKN